MKKLLTFIIVLMISYTYSYSELDTLTYWVRGGSIGAYNNSAITMQWAHFYPEAPCYIKNVIVYFYGNAGSANMYIAGQEAGSSVPEVVGATLIPIWGQNGINFNAQPNTATPTMININPNIYIDGNQFFVGFTGISSGMFLGSDQVKKTPWCTSELGGTYLYQALYINDGTGWANGENAFLVDVIVDYPRKTSPNYLRDVTEDYLLPLNLGNQSYAVADLDEDSYLDLLISGKLFKNMDGQYFEDITAESGLSGNPTANAIVDIDNDGDLDIIFLMQGAGTKSKLFINDGTGKFTSKDLSIPELNGVTSFSIADINNDKYPDIFIGQLWKTYPESLPNLLLLNNKSNDFTNNTTILYPQYDGTWNYPNEQWDPANNIVNRNRNSRGSQWVDFDNDGDLDLYVTNYFLQKDEFYRNNGDGTFTDIITQKNIDVNKTGSNHGTGVDWYDYDNDGDMDLFLSQFAHPRFIKDYDHRPATIYKNSGAGNFSFTDTYDPANFKSTIGLGYEETYAGGAWGDINNDGRADLVITTFYGCRFIDFYTQKEDNTFENRTFEFGLEGIVTGEDACWLDFDNDGKLDLLIADNGKFRLFKNYYDLNYDWLEVDLQNVDSEKWNIIGTRVKVQLTNGKVFMQEVSVGRGQKMQKPYRLHFGLDRMAEISKVQVRWTGTTVWEDYYGIAPNKIVKLVKDKGGQPKAPDAPILAKPNNNSVDIPLNGQKLTWNKSAGAESYHIQVATNANFGDIIAENKNTSKAEFTLGKLQSNTKYYWRVSASNFAGTGNFSEVWNFTTIDLGSDVPDAPELLTPDDGAVNVSKRTGKFSWKEVDNATSYTLWVSESYKFDELKINLEGFSFTEYPVADLKSNTTYYWKVRGVNESGEGKWSTMRNFTTDNSNPNYPIAPNLLSPNDNAVNVAQDAYLAWEIGTYATSYNIQVSKVYNFTGELTIDAITSNTNYPVFSLEGETKYYWRVYSINARGESDMPSSSRNFTTGIFSDVKDVGFTTKSYLGDIVPNPSSGMTKFTFGINHPSNVSIKLFDINGSEIATIFEDYRDIGLYNFQWNSESINSGIYSVVFKANGFTNTKKLIIIK